MKKIYAGVFALGLIGLAVAVQQEQTTKSNADQASEARRLMPLGAVPVPSDNPITSEKVALGKRLFFETALSGSNKMACSTCHKPDHGYADTVRLSVGDGQHGKTLGRHTPSLLNIGYNLVQFWDGRAATVEEQALMPVKNPDEMNQNLETLPSELETLKYGPLFEKAFGTPEITLDRIAKALATFERTLNDNDTPFDRWMKGDKRALSYEATRGLMIFMSSGRCIACHSGPNFTNASHKFGNPFINIGVTPLPGDPVDIGRYAVLTEEKDKQRKIFVGAFKVPSLRGIGKSAPYMHNGSLKTLEEVVDFYSRGGDQKKIRATNFTPEEKRFVVAFLREGLTGK